MTEHDDYLWDRSGDADPEVVRLEQLLAPLAHRGERLRDLPERAPRRSVTRIVIPLLTAAASIALVVVAAQFAAQRNGAGWAVEALDGAPLVAGRRIASDGSIRAGEVLVTDADSRARLDVGGFGTVDIEPDTRLRVVSARDEAQRLALDRGRIHALIWAPPGRFAVSTPSATAIDLGCAYTLDVDPAGHGLVRVISGWVAFEDAGRESFIPQGAICATRRGRGPGTPRYLDAPDGYEGALATLDFGAPDDPGRAAALDLVLREARSRDALTLWHLLSRGSRDERARVYDRMAALVPPPAGVTRDAILRGDQPALDAWWNALGLDTADWWRVWKTRWGRK